MESHDWQSIETWMETYGDRLLRVIYLIIGDYHQAEELAQEVFLRAYRSLGSFRRDASPYTWLYRIAVNLCRSHIRRKSLLAFLPLMDQASRRDTENETVYEKVEKEMTGSRVRECIHQLPVHYREVILLHYYEDMKIAEMAEVLERSEGTIKSQLSRGRKALEEVMRREGLDYEKEAGSQGMGQGVS